MAHIATDNQFPGAAAAGGPDGRMTKRQAKWRDALERAGWTAGQAFFAVLLADGTINKVSELPLLSAGVSAVLASLITVAVAFRFPPKDKGGPDWIGSDLPTRLAKTFGATFVGVLGVNTLSDLSTVDWDTVLANAGPAAQVAIIATIGALGKGVLAKQDVPGAATPSTLKPTTYLTAIGLTPDEVGARTGSGAGPKAIEAGQLGSDT